MVSFSFVLFCFILWHLFPFFPFLFCLVLFHGTPVYACVRRANGPNSIFRNLESAAYPVAPLLFSFFISCRLEHLYVTAGIPAGVLEAWQLLHTSFRNIIAVPVRMMV
ncbi:hypothetical protein BJ741DRAFT_626413 [Chytriomyces cf. hyalinus JEL632]|nr:hypothetical protein BJ741DRAFT_626413 [Chytriomyces cf. hyalinus JEL632]